MSDFKDLKALYINCTLKPSPQQSHTEGLMEVSKYIMRSEGVEIDSFRAVDHVIAPGVYPDMTAHGATEDAWPELFERVMAADILILGSPIWLGERSSICTRVIERLYAMSGKVNEKGQYLFYGKVGGTIITGNEDGVKHCAMGILYALQHIGYSIPPQADSGWLGEIGPGPSYLDPESKAKDNEFTNRNTTFMTYNLLHLANILKGSGGYPNKGNSREEWENGNRWAFENPEYRSGS
ncbi:Multimeric flavodoxin WrbA [Robiginitalea myxolifaciens]|uniref:Multimeric flavodoxin WrbA n=1 Tax=Robiginitalea myxolifaciens TaxID=400055 RepID=A0A1I6H3J7_9FLAO|nr:NAD(P)H-dependent oxidoreductase [Robiginitalea myxolifaciens]SFR48947.1 Multimeric flavodoxin WrbA [Robiginitalea myxolifaciens]